VKKPYGQILHKKMVQLNMEDFERKKGQNKERETKLIA
jgi:hypothetical protein